MYYDREETPRVFGSTNIILAVLIHVALFLGFWFLGALRPSDPDETIIPIDCVVVVHENLDGVDDEPPPDREVTETEPEPEPEPEPTPPEPEPEPVVLPPPPDDVVIIPDKVEEKKPPEVKPPEVKPPEVKPPEKPKETPEEKKKRLAEERKKRLEDMRNRMVKDKTPPPRNNGRTEQRPPNWEKLLNEGYRPGAMNRGLDASEEQKCLNRIKEAFHSKWSPRPAWTSELRMMKLQVTFGPGGRVTNYRLIQSSGDAKADATVQSAASRVPSVAGLTQAFLEKHSTVTIEFEVTPM